MNEQATLSTFNVGGLGNTQLGSIDVTLSFQVTMNLKSDPNAVTAIGDFCWALGVPVEGGLAYVPIKGGEMPEYMIVALPHGKRSRIPLAPFSVDGLSWGWNRDLFKPTLDAAIRTTDGSALLVQIIDGIITELEKPKEEV